MRKEKKMKVEEGEEALDLDPKRRNEFHDDGVDLASEKLRGESREREREKMNGWGKLGEE